MDARLNPHPIKHLGELGCEDRIGFRGVGQIILLVQIPGTLPHARQNPHVFSLQSACRVWWLAPRALNCGWSRRVFLDDEILGAGYPRHPARQFSEKIFRGLHRPGWHGIREGNSIGDSCHERQNVPASRLQNPRTHSSGCRLRSSATYATNWSPSTSSASQAVRTAVTRPPGPSGNTTNSTQTSAQSQRRTGRGTRAAHSARERDANATTNGQ